MLSRRIFCLAAAFSLVLPAWSEEPLTAADVLRRVDERLRSLQDYACEVETESRAGKKREALRMRLWAKQPGMLRVKVLQGRDRGSEVCIGPSGKIKGHKGGILKGIVVSLSPDDRRLKDLRGLPITMLEWSESLNSLRKKAALPGARLTLAPHRKSSDPYEVTVAYRDGDRSMREVFRFDSQLYIPVGGEVYENEQLVDQIVFRNARLNPGLGEQWFRL